MIHQQRPKTNALNASELLENREEMFLLNYMNFIICSRLAHVAALYCVICAERVKYVSDLVVIAS